MFFVSNPAIGLWSTRARFGTDSAGHGQVSAAADARSAGEDSSDDGNAAGGKANESRQELVSLMCQLCG